MRVALIDPSLFTLPYDLALADGLRAAGVASELIGRPLQAEEVAPDGAVEPLFYRALSRAPWRDMPRSAALVAKGIAHGFGMRTLRRELERRRPDVIHFQWLPLPVVDRRFLAGLRRVAPLVLTVHDSNPFNAAPSSRLQRWGTDAVLDDVDLLIVHTRQGRDRLRAKGIAPTRIAIVAHGLLGDAAGRPGAPVPQPADGTTTFLLFGKIKPYKGADTLIEAFIAMAPALRRRARLRIVGKPYLDLAPLRARVAAAGLESQVEIAPGFVDDADVPALFAPGTVAAMPYREIDASGVLAIALAQGCPIVASRIGSFAELLAPERDALLVAPDDVAGLAAAMERLAADPELRARLGLAARRRAEAIPSWAEIGATTAGLYAELISMRGSRHRAA
ncbi:MAG: glycosyltransferase [Alphaproteobacteria bacterium]|nr:glycosyltransferase [Alphaproteobacteria bacterium]